MIKERLWEARQLLIGEGTAAEIEKLIDAAMQPNDDGKEDENVQDVTQDYRKK